MQNRTEQSCEYPPVNVSPLSHCASLLLVGFCYSDSGEEPSARQSSQCTSHEATKMREDPSTPALMASPCSTLGRRQGSGVLDGYRGSAIRAARRALGIVAVLRALPVVAGVKNQSLTLRVARVRRYDGPSLRVQPTLCSTEDHPRGCRWTSFGGQPFSLRSGRTMPRRLPMRPAFSRMTVKQSSYGSPAHTWTSGGKTSCVAAQKALSKGPEVSRTHCSSLHSSNPPQVGAMNCFSPSIS